MDDPAPLRKSDELLGKLPEQHGSANARFGRNPVWLLLKGLEGFDTERASECLVKLFSNRYDTISVLKLATKRDLVKDAGILPGDALRILAAATEYDAPRDPSPGPTSQCGHGGKSALPVMQPQQQKVLKQDAALRQEAIKEGKLVDQVGPNQEAVKQAPTLPPLRGAFGNGRTGYTPADARFAPADPTLAPPWRALVDGKTGCIYYWNQVLNITQYNKPLPPVEFGPSFLSAPLPPGPSSSVTSAPRSVGTPELIPPGISYPHICRLCNTECPTYAQVLSHYNGQKHSLAFQKTIQFANIPKAVNPTVGETKKVAQPPVVWESKQPTQPIQAASELMQPLQSSPIAASLHACGVCNVQCYSEIVLRSHFNGNKHAKKMKAATNENNNQPTQYLYCSICDVTCTSNTDLVMHFKGKEHAENMKEDSDSGNSSYYSDTEPSDC